VSRRLLIPAVVLLVIGLGAVGLGRWILSESGTAWVLARLESRAAPALRFSRSEGTLDRLTLFDVEILVGGHALALDSIRVVWQPLQLLWGRLEVDELTVDTAQYRTLPSAGSSANEGAAFTSPVQIRVRRAALGALTAMVGGTTYRLGPISFSVELAGQTLRVLQLEAAANDRIQLTAAAQIDLGERLRYAGNARWQADVAGTLVGGGIEFDGVWPELALRQEFTLPFAALIEGSLSFATPLRADLTASWTDAAWSGVSRVRSPGGQLTLSGSPEAFEFAGAARLIFDEDPLELTVAGSGAGAALLFDRIMLDVAQAQLLGTGTVALDRRDWQFEVQADGVNPARWAPDWPGQLGGRARFSGRLMPAFEWSLTEAEVAGTLRDRPLAAQGAVAYREDQWLLEAVRVQSDATRLELDGTAGRSGADLRFAAESDDLGDLWPTAQGSVSAQGRMAGAWRQAALVLDLTGEDWALGSYHAGTLSLSARAGLDPGAPLAVDAIVTAGVVGSQAIDELRLEIEGSAQRHEATLALRAPDAATALLRVSGALDGTQWQGTIVDFTLDQSSLGRWQLVAPAELTLAPGVARAGELCLAQMPAQVCAEATLQGAASDHIELNVRDFDLAALQPFLDQQLVVRGLYQARASLRDPTGQVAGVLTIEGAATQVDFRLVGGESYTARLASVNLQADLQEWGLALRASVVGDGSGRGSADLDARFSDIRLPDPEISASLNLEWPDVSILSLLSPDVGEVAGAAELALTATGSVAVPHLSGEVAWRGGRLGVPRWGLLVDTIEAHGTSPDGRTLAFDATGQIGDGQLRLQGETDLDYRAGWPTRLRLTGDTVEAVQLPDAEIYVVPDLTVEARLPDVTVMGMIEVPRARISLVGLPDQAIVPSPDAVTHGVEAAAPTRPVRLHSTLQVNLGDDVRYTGAGLNVLVTGEMALAYESGQTAVATGTLNMSGQYDAYGQALTLERGALLFAGSLSDPVLDVLAVRQIDTQRVGIQLTGTLGEPQARIMSDPTLGEADALAYLMFGRPLTTGGEQQSQALQNAALALGLQQTLPVVQRIGQSLGLDELSVQSTVNDPGALMAGKYLSPRVYIRYSYGIFNQIGGFLLRFRVNDRLSLETRSGDEQSLDLMYTVEKN
jgi:translocation and assembly module TamB